MDRSGRLGCVVAWDAAGERELAEQFLQSHGIATDRRINLAVSALEIRIRDHPRPAVAGTADEDRVQVPRLDQSVEVRVEKIQARRGPPMAQEPRFDVLDLQRLAQ